jgi:hypothetical protein
VPGIDQKKQLRPRYLHAGFPPALQQFQLHYEAMGFFQIGTNLVFISSMSPLTTPRTLRQRCGATTSTSPERSCSFTRHYTEAMNEAHRFDGPAFFDFDATAG